MPGHFFPKSRFPPLLLSTEVEALPHISTLSARLLCCRVVWQVRPSCEGGVQACMGLRLSAWVWVSVGVGMGLGRYGSGLVEGSAIYVGMLDFGVLWDRGGG